MAKMTPTVMAALITVAFGVVGGALVYRSSLIDLWMRERKEDTEQNRLRIDRLEALRMTPCKECDE